MIPQNDPLLTAREGAKEMQIGIATWWRWVAKGILPPPVKLGGTSRWPRSEIHGVIDRAKAERNAA